MLLKKLQLGMESSALVAASIECGDGGCKTPLMQTSSDDGELSNTKQFSFGSSFKCDVGPAVDCGLSPNTESGNQECSVYIAAELLCSLHLNEVVNAQQSTNSCKDHEDNERKNVCSSALLAPVSTAAKCDSSTGCPIMDAAVICDETNMDGEEHVLENNHLHSTTNDQKPDDMENNGATVPQPTSDDVIAENRSHHARTDSSSSMNYYMAIGHDVVFSGGIEYRPYGCEWHLHDIMELVGRDLSEPYSIYTYRYFIYNWPNLCFRVSLSFFD